jgi:hypothetical protein
MGGGDAPNSSANSGSFNGDACTVGPRALGNSQIWTAMFWNGILGVNTKHGFRDISDGSSNVIIVGESYYDTMELDFWWGCGLRTKHASNNVPNGVCATSFPINSGEDIYKANVNPTVIMNQGLHNPIRTRTFGSYHTGGCHFLLGDGSVHFLSENMNLQVYQSLGQMADGLPIGGVEI